MIGKIIGAVAGSKMAETTRGIGGPTGAALGIGAAALAKRLSLPAFIALTAGGYFVKKHLDRKQAEQAAPPAKPKVKPTAA